MKEAACSWRVMTGRIDCEGFNARIKPAGFSPAPPKAGPTPIPSRPLTIASYTRIGGDLRLHTGHLQGGKYSPTLEDPRPNRRPPCRPSPHHSSLPRLEQLLSYVGPNAKS